MRIHRDANMSIHKTTYMRIHNDANMSFHKDRQSPPNIEATRAGSVSLPGQPSSVVTKCPFRTRTRPGQPLPGARPTARTIAAQLAPRDHVLAPMLADLGAPHQGDRPRPAPASTQTPRGQVPPRDQRSRIDNTVTIRCRNAV
jgi:hypothetical protein